MFQTKVVEKIKAHILCSITFFDIYAIYGIMWKNIVEPGRPQMTVWRMCIACWIPKATNTHFECVILIAFPLQQWLLECISVLSYTYIVYHACYTVCHCCVLGGNYFLQHLYSSFCFIVKTMHNFLPFLQQYKKLTIVNQH
jgi:hypothetical protein